MNYSEQLLKVMQPQETYRGYPLRQIGINTYQFGIKTGTKEEIKKFIDGLSKIKIKKR